MYILALIALREHGVYTDFVGEQGKKLIEKLEKSLKYIHNDSRTIVRRYT